jgi:hypothetical protein
VRFSSDLLLLPPSGIQIFSLTPSTQAPSVYAFGHAYKATHIYRFMSSII